VNVLPASGLDWTFSVAPIKSAACLATGRPSLTAFLPYWETTRKTGPQTFSISLASAIPSAGRPYSLAVTRARLTSCRQRKEGRVWANSSLVVR
jgi:hypothetical protein